jgi:hypothetical protein
LLSKKDKVTLRSKKIPHTDLWSSSPAARVKKRLCPDEGTRRKEKSILSPGVKLSILIEKNALSWAGG